MSLRKKIKKIPKSLIIGGIKWKITHDKLSGASFNWEKHIIVLNPKDTEERLFANLLHETSEIIMVNNNMRYMKCLSEVGNGDYLFIFSHDRFDTFLQELNGILKQIYG